MLLVPHIGLGAGRTDETRLGDTWGLDVFLITVVVIDTILFFLYGLTFHRVWHGTRYPFIVFLVTLLFVSCIAGPISAGLLHRSAAISGDKDASEIDFAQLQLVNYFMSIFECIRLICNNLALWCFSFRYWNIAHMMTAFLSGTIVTRRYKLTTIGIFLVGAAANVISPIMYTIY